jgi:hypothetical protein
VNSEKQQRASNQGVSVRRANERLEAMRQVVANDISTIELRDRLLPLNGPVLDKSDRAQLPATIKVRGSRLLDQAASQVTRQNEKVPPRNPRLLAPELLRNAFASLALGFAGLARRPGSAISLLVEIDDGWWQLRHGRSGGRRLKDRRIVHQQ